VKWLADPVVIKLIALLTGGVALFFLWAWLVRKVRIRLTVDESENFRPVNASSTSFTLAAYQGVIQRLKEQEAELQALRQSARREAAETENISEAVLSNLTSGVVLFNTAGLVQQVNLAAKNILGYASPVHFHARDAFKGVTALRGLDESNTEGNARLLEALENCVRAGRPARRLEADYTTPSGQRRTLGITLSPVRSAKGEPLGAACLISDLTDISELARQMRMKENLAALGEMSAGIAHEFKNSLATISGYAQMLRTTEDAGTVRQFAEKIAAATNNLARIVTEFLNFARPQEADVAGSTAPPPQAVDVRSIIEECAREYNLELQFSGFEQPHTIKGDRTLLRQLFSNLLRNSAEAAQNGQRTKVEVRAEAIRGQLRLVIRDNGCGIPREKLSRIFIPFFTTKPQGTGLGLALVHRVVSQHGGAISVSSDDSGTSFALEFPQLAKQAIGRG
jgi:two-component system, NtrC family, sensor histidine kinase AtoS